MSAVCQSCQGRASLFLCERCVEELRDNLTRLAQGPYLPSGAEGKTKSGGKWHIERRSPGLLESLTDVVVGKTRIGSGGGGHRKRGDEIRGLYEPDTEKGRPAPQRAAGLLLDAIRNGLSSTLRDLCESHGSELPPCNSTAQIALQLASHAHAIACDEGAGQTYAEVQSYIRQIEHAIDRPTGRKFLGGCPACGRELFASEDAIEVTCRTCRQTHNCNRLQLLMMNDLETKKLTFDQIVKASLTQPEGYQIPERTLRHWRQHGKLKIRGYRRPDGTSWGDNKNSDDDVPLYLWPDVRKLRTERHGRKAG